MKNEKCPLCGNGITNDELKAVKAKLNDENAKAMAEREIAIRKQLTSENQTNLEAQRVKIEAESRKQIDELKKQNTDLNKSLTELTAAQIQFKEQLEKANAEKLKVEIEKNKLAHQKELDEQRKLLDDANQKKVASVEAINRQKIATLEKTTETLKRQLEDKSANTLGDGAEIDLYEELRREFSGDKITRVKKGTNGADIHQDVYENGIRCGRILHESKNCTQWRESFTAKAREDQVACDADHAVLSSTVFPKGQSQLFVSNDVIVVHPGRAVYVAIILRRSLIQLSKSCSSEQDRAAKTQLLYNFIKSPQFNNRLAQTSNYAEELLKYEVEDENHFDKMAKKRGAKITDIKNSVRDLEIEIAQIIGGEQVPVSSNGQPLQVDNPIKPK